MMRFIIFCRRIVPILVGAAIVMLVTGCACNPAVIVPYPVSIEQQAEGSVTIDVIGATPSDLDRWRTYSINKYLEPDNLARRDADKVTNKVPRGQIWTLNLADEIWTTWKKRGVNALVIIVDLPGITVDDDRRKVLLLNECQWIQDTRKLEVQVKQSSVRIMTPERVK